MSCRPARLNQAFHAVLLNAAQAISAGGAIFVEALQQGERVIVSVRDEGRGMGPEQLGRVFEPGFSTRGERIGAGLGLAICRQIVFDHSGDIDIESEVGRGTTVRISLPRSGRSATTTC